MTGADAAARRRVDAVEVEAAAVSDDAPSEHREERRERCCAPADLHAAVGRPSATAACRKTPDNRPLKGGMDSGPWDRELGDSFRLLYVARARLKVPGGAWMTVERLTRCQALYGAPGRDCRGSDLQPPCVPKSKFAHLHVDGSGSRQVHVAAFDP